MIFEEGEKAEWVYILLEGKVRISIDLTSKPTYITVAMIDEPNWAFGWSGDRCSLSIYSHRHL